MYNSVYVPVDNSDHSNTAVDLGVKLGKAFGVDRVVGSHVYAAKLHDIRFKQMEFTLPEEYKEEQELEKQRKIHDSLIARGLQLISDCYLEDMDQKAQDAGLNFERVNADGRNFEVITNEINQGQYDLVVMGALGSRRSPRLQGWKRLRACTPPHCNRQPHHPPNRQWRPQRYRVYLGRHRRLQPLLRRP